jgi:hypothetical protein
MGPRDHSISAPDPAASTATGRATRYPSLWISDNPPHRTPSNPPKQGDGAVLWPDDDADDILRTWALL